MKDKHTSVIYFHGIGNPLRHISISHFLDHFDLYGQSQSKSEIGKPRNFSYKYDIVESSDEIVNFIEIKRVLSKGSSTYVGKTIRFYEAYWVPEAGNEFSFAYLLFWLVLRALNPLFVIFSAWRSYPALRLSSLHRLSSNRDKIGWFIKVERKYRDFENWENRKNYPKGSFSDFIDFIKKSDIPKSEISKIVDAAIEWKMNFMSDARHVAWHLLSSVFIILWSVLIITYSIYIIYGEIFSNFNNIEYSSFATALFVIATTIIAMPVIFRLKNYIHDVLTWTLSSEKDARFQNRKRVLQYAQGLIRHVVDNQECGECVIVSHSLGTCIATEALLREGQKLKARNLKGSDSSNDNINKISYIFTIGSPIDLIFLFFYGNNVFSHRYHKIIEEQRLSVSLPPFWNVGKSGKAKIINIWSRFDPISTRVFSLRKNISERRDSIENIEAFCVDMPSPIGSHTSYYSDRYLMKMIYDAIMIGRVDFPKNRDDFMKENFGNISSQLIKIFYLLLLSLLTFSFICQYVFWAFPIFVFLFLSLFEWRGKIKSDYERAYGHFLKR